MKDRWPELIGRNVEEARVIIVRERPGVHIEIVEGEVVVRDHRLDRVRIHIDRMRKVIREPIIG